MGDRLAAIISGTAGSPSTRKAGGLNFRLQAEKAKAHQCFKRSGWKTTIA
jgi:hypothetical protein